MSDLHDPRILIDPRIASRREKAKLAIRALIVAVTLLAGSTAARAADSSPLDVTVVRGGAVVATPIGDQLTTVPGPRPPFGFNILLGEVTHRTDQTDPFDPADQQRNQSHGLTTEPWEDIPLRRLFE
ncbi:MAG TPA: hypothetical protein VGB82_13800 [Alphaproteobacteria bacterium]